MANADLYNVRLTRDDLELLVATINAQLNTFYSLPAEKLQEIEGAEEMFGKLLVLAAFLRTQNDRVDND